MKLLPILIFTLLFPVIIFADEITIRPFLIDETMEPRESTTETVVLTSGYTNRSATVYATVNEITVGTDGAILDFVPSVMTDRTNSITSWIAVSRGRITIPAGESYELPIDIKIHPFAEPGQYHAFVGFVEGSKRNVAEQTALSGDADGIIVTVTVTDQRVDSMRISSMAIDRFVTDSDQQQVAITIENSGDFESILAGEIIFYDNRGSEVSALPFNTEGVSVAPEETKMFVTSIPLGSNLGRYKANANLTYGENQRASLFDSASFYMFPLYYLYIGIGSLSLLLLLLLLLLMRRETVTGNVAVSGDDVPVFIRDGHKPQPKDHDIDLTK
ncbi:MAG: hypothetical protein ACI9SY_000084 [Candidatus Paceibacteria bacterium]|jgi:hypothetical protein